MPTQVTHRAPGRISPARATAFLASLLGSTLLAGEVRGQDSIGQNAVTLEQLTVEGSGVGLTRANPAGLTNRQLDVAKLVARGFSNAEIAGRLFISPKTAEVHVSAVLNKLGVGNRRAVVVRAGDLGLA